MEGTGITRGDQSHSTTTYARANHAPPNRTLAKTHVAKYDRSHLLFRSAIASMVLTLILLPGGFRALTHTGLGWEAWSFSRFLVLAIVSCHLICCWGPLALRYFKPGECRDVPAFVIATMTLFVQFLICRGLFENYSVWFGGG
jgi:hypothetical protein